MGLTCQLARQAGSQGCPLYESCRAQHLALDWQSTGRVEGWLCLAHVCLVWCFVPSSSCRFLMGIAAQPPAGKTAPERWISFCKVSAISCCFLNVIWPSGALLCNTCAAHWLVYATFIGGAPLDVWRRWALVSLMWTASGCTTRSRCGSLSDGSTAWAQQHWMPLPPLRLPQSMQ